MHILNRCKTSAEQRNIIELCWNILVLLTLLLTSVDLSAQPPPPLPQTETTPSKQMTSSATPRPVENVVANDHPNDQGGSIDITWKLSPDDASIPGKKMVFKYRIERSETQQNKANWLKIGEVDFGKQLYIDRNAEPEVQYKYQVTALTDKGIASRSVQAEIDASARTQWFDSGRIWFAIILLLICGSVVIYILLARAGYPLRVRKIAGLEVVDEAVGRATEMGRSTLFVPGILDMNDIQTVAGMTVLSHVATTSAEYDSEIDVPTCRSLVMTTAQETVEAAFLSAGRPDAYNADKIYYVTDEQFGYVAYLSGKMVREKPAACFYMGAFFAESLILAETGNAIGAIQIAGTAMPAQLPFFVAACDYTLIGEEFFAASAYLSKEPDQLGSLKGQDVGKMLVAALLVVGSLLATVEPLTTWMNNEQISETTTPDVEQDSQPWFKKAHEYLTQQILTSG